MVGVAAVAMMVVGVFLVTMAASVLEPAHRVAAAADAVVVAAVVVVVVVETLHQPWANSW